MPVRPSAPAEPQDHEWSASLVRCALLDGRPPDEPNRDRDGSRVHGPRADPRTGRRTAPGSPIWYPWQASGLARIALLKAAWHALAAAGTPAGSAAQFHGLLDDAERSCTTKPTLGQRLSGVAVERAWTHLHAAETVLVASSGADSLASLLPRAVDLTARSLPASSAQRTAVAEPVPPDDPSSAWLVAWAVEAAHGIKDAAHDRARSFRNVIIAAGLLVAVAVTSLLALALAAPASLPMCTADLSACVIDGPSRTLDVPLVALVGAGAGAMSGVVALRRLRGTSTPYQVPLALAALKVPTGALTAVLGLLLLRAGFADTTFAAETPAGLLGWAVVLGLAQEAITRLADRQGELVLSTVTPTSTPTTAAPRS